MGNEQTSARLISTCIGRLAGKQQPRSNRQRHAQPLSAAQSLSQKEERQQHREQRIKSHRPPDAAKVLTSPAADPVSTAPDWQAARPAPSRSSTESPRRRKRTFLPEHTAARPESRRPCPLSSSCRLLMGFRFRGPSAHESFMLLESRKSAIQTVTLQRRGVLFHHGDTEGTEISQRHQGSPCVSAHSAENPSQPGKDFRLHKLHKMKPQMNTDRRFHLCSSVFICGCIHSGVSPIDSLKSRS